MVIRFSRLARSFRNTHFNERLGFLSLNKWPTNHSKPPQFYRHSKKLLTAHTHTSAHSHMHDMHMSQAKTHEKCGKYSADMACAPLNKNAPLAIRSRYVLSAGAQNTFCAALFACPTKKDKPPTFEILYLRMPIGKMCAKIRQMWYETKKKQSEKYFDFLHRRKEMNWKENVYCYCYCLNSADISYSSTSTTIKEMDAINSLRAHLD